MCVCPCVVTLTVAFLCRFSPNLTQRCKPQKVRTSSLGVNIAHPFLYFTPKNCQFGPEVWKTNANMKHAISALNVHVWPKFPRVVGNRGREHDGDVRFLTGSRNKAVSRMRNEKYAIWPLVMAESPKLLHSHGLVNSATGQIPCSTD